MVAVWDEAKHKYVGFLSLMDLVGYTVMVSHERALQEGTSSLEYVMSRCSSTLPHTATHAHTATHKHCHRFLMWVRKGCSLQGNHVAAGAPITYIFQT